MHYTHYAFFVFNNNIFDQIKFNARLNYGKQKLASFLFTPFKHSNFANRYGENKSLETCLFCLVIDEKPWGTDMYHLDRGCTQTFIVFFCAQWVFFLKDSKAVLLFSSYKQANMMYSGNRFIFTAERVKIWLVI